MTQDSNLKTIRERNKWKRLVGWVFMYTLLIAGFIFLVYWQASRVNTLGFASGQLQLTTSKTKYVVGKTVSYTLKNELSQPITYKYDCMQEPLYVYAWNGSSWGRIHDKVKTSACAAKTKQVSIPSGGSYTQSFAHWPDLFKKPGIYRIVALATNYTSLPYADFLVIAKPAAPQIQVKTQIIIQKVITPIYVTVPSSGGSDGGVSTDN